MIARNFSRNSPTKTVLALVAVWAIQPPVITETAVVAPAPAESPEALAAGFPIVGVDASTGRLAAFDAFFSGIPAGVDQNMSFVLVQHLT